MTPACRCTNCGRRLAAEAARIDERVDHAIDEHGIENLDEYRQLYEFIPDRRIPV